MKPRDRRIGFVYALYFASAFGSSPALKSADGTAVHSVGLALALLSTAIYAVLVVLLARVFSRGHRTAALLAGVAGLTGCLIQAYGIAVRSLPAEHLALAVFGVFCILLGWLVVVSDIVPRVFGVLLIAAGVGWMTFFVPTATEIVPYVIAIGGLAEVAFMLWLLIRGIPERSTA